MISTQLNLFSPNVTVLPEDKSLAFDIEIIKPIPEGETDWKRHRPLGISCAALAEPDQEPIVWYPGNGKDIIRGGTGGALSQFDLISLVEHLLEKQAHGYTIFTWNGLAFDFDILAEESGLVEECKQLALNHVDMMFHFFCLKGYFLGLETAARGMGLREKFGGIQGAMVPTLWAGSIEDRKRVLQYVANDAMMTLELAQIVCKAGVLEWISKSGRPNACDFPLGWLPVHQAMQLPELDTSWMTNPVSRSSMYAWLESGK